MNDTPKRWLIEDNQGERSVMDGYADALAAAKAWVCIYGRFMTPNVKVTELAGQTFTVDLHSSVRAEFR